MVFQRSTEKNNLCQHSIKLIGDLHFKLWIISQKLNKVYSFQMVLLILRSFFGILNVSFYIVTNIFNANVLPAREYLFLLNSASVKIIVSLLLALVSSKVSAEANELGNILLNRNFSSLRNADLDVLCILLQLLHTKVKFRASGLFQVNTTLLYMLFSSIVYYSIIVLQFDIGVNAKTNNK